MRGFSCTVLGILSSVAVAQPFSYSLDFEDDAVGGQPGMNDGSLWITASWWSSNSDNCGDGTVVADGSNAMIIAVGSGGSCADRPGAVVGSGSMNTGNGVMILNFRNGKNPDIVEFDLYQFAITNPGTVTVYSTDNSVLDTQSFNGNSDSISISTSEPISRVEVANAHAFSLDNLRWSGTETDGTLMRLIDFEDESTGPSTGAYGDFRFRVLEGYVCDTGNVSDSMAPANGQRSLVLDGGNPNNEPDDGCSNNIHGVAVSAPDQKSYAGTIGIDIHPGVLAHMVSFDLRQFAVTGPINVTAYDRDGQLIVAQTYSSNSDSVELMSDDGIDSIEVQGLYPFTLDDLEVMGVGQDVTCDADLNNDGVLDFFDVSEFLSLYQAGCP